MDQWLMGCPVNGMNLTGHICKQDESCEHDNERNELEDILNKLEDTEKLTRKIFYDPRNETSPPWFK